MKFKRTFLFFMAMVIALTSVNLGGTIAWFTDRVTNSNNRIDGGTLDIALLYDGKEIDPDQPLFDHISLWEPGVVAYENMTIRNVGTQAFQYQMFPNAVNYNYVVQNGKSLLDALKFTVVDAHITGDKDAEARAAAISAGNWYALNGAQPFTGTMESGAKDKDVSLIIWWEPTATDNDLNLNNGKSVNTAAEGGRQDLFIDLGVTVTAVQASVAGESDSFGHDYDAAVTLPEMDLSVRQTVSIVNNNGYLANDVVISAGQVTAVVPAGTKLADASISALTLTVYSKPESDFEITLNETEKIKAYDVHIDGVADDNEIPIQIALGEIAPKNMNIGPLRLEHEGVPMSYASATPGKNQFEYDPATGALTIYLATFSEVAVVADTENAWNGEFKYDWYKADATELTIASADQLAGFGAIVGGMNGKTQDSFTGKTVKLIADVNLGDAEANNTSLIFYPIGYYNNVGNYNKVSGKVNDKDVVSGVHSFEGTFDGNGHTIANFYQNTWEMFGDYNSGYSETPNHYKDAMGLFGYVYNGTVKNLTVDHFSSDGEFAPTGVIAAYAGGTANFKNIAITNCEPATYNTGVAGIVGWEGESGSTFNFENITVDASNTISALWGSWDVGAAGLLGYLGADSKANLKNCNVSATIDVNNDVCGNYQYYWYRYCGMLIGTVDKRLDNGKGALDLSNITATNCTVQFGDRHEYFYCEFVDNSIASYTHEYQFSRIPHDKLKFNDSNNNGRVDKAEVGSVTGCTHDHESEGTEVIDGKEILKENNQAIYIPFRQLFGGYGWGVNGADMDNYASLGVKVDDEGYEAENPPPSIEESDKEKADVKFKSKFTGDFLYRVGNGNAVKIGSLFEEITENTVNDSGVVVSIDKVDENHDVGATYKANTSDWTQGTIQFSGTGVVKVTIQDYDYCIPTVLYLEVVDAENVTSAVGANGKNIVLLEDVEFSDGYLYYKNSTVYGNGFTLDITSAPHSDLKDSSDTNSNRSAYCNIWMVDSRFDNIKVVGSVYPEVGMTADSDYGNAAIRTEGECFITNSYISNCRVPLRVQGNTTVVDSVVDGGRYANIELRSGKLTLDGVTTINTMRKGSDNKTDVIGFGIVIHSEAANCRIDVIGDGLKQYNWAGENKHKSILSGDTYLSNAYKLIFNANNSDSIYFDYNNDRYVNTGILCLCADINKDVVTGLNDRYCQEVSGYDAWVLTYDNSKHSDWFKESVSVEAVAHVPEQYPCLPKYSGNAAQTVEFTKGETYYFDTSVLTAEKLGQTLDVSSVVMNGTTYNYGEKIPLTEGGVYEIVYTVVDPYNYNADATPKDAFDHKISITVTAIAKDAEILAPKFTFIDQNGNKYESTTVKAGDKTYVMPNVTAADPTTNSMSSINIGSASISGTTVYFPVATGYTVRSGSNFNRYYPLFNGINITDYTIAGDTTGTTYTTSGNHTSLVGSSGNKFIIPANGGQTNCGDYVKTDGQAGNAAGNSDSGWQGAGYNTSYGGTYLKSGNTNASSGADKNGYERIVWVEYCFNAGNGDVYYYRIGYHCNKESAQSCVTGDTLVTLADGSKKEIQNVTYEDHLLVWDFYKGEYAAVPSAIIFNHGEGEHTLIHLTFEDGTTVKVVKGHRFLDVEANEFVYIDDSNAADYVGHSFYKQDGEGYTTVKLADYKVTQEFSDSYSLISALHYNFFVEDLFSSPFMVEDAGAFEYFEIGEGMKYDEAAMQTDIEKYGLYTYEEFADLITPEQFEGFNVKYMKIAVGKGLFTYDEILRMIEEYLEA